MNARRCRTALSCTAVGLITVAASCREPTQVTVRITTGEKCSDMSPVQTVVGPSLQVTQQRFVDRFTTAVSSACDGTGLVGTLVITPGGDRGTILVAAGVRVRDLPAPDAATCADPEISKRCIIARRAFTFLENTSLVLPVHLDPLCVGTACDPASTCFKGSCVSAEVTCRGDVCGLAQENPGGDAGATEAGSSDGAYDPDVEGGPFEDASRDSGDGSVIVDGSPDADGSVDPDALPCGAKSSPLGEFCSVNGGKGRGTPGSCGAPEPDRYCCKCVCGTTGSVVSCNATMSMNGSMPVFVGSCFPTTCPQ